MATNVTEAFEDMADPGFWEQAGAIAGGAGLGIVSRTVFETLGPNLPDEAFGLVGIGVGGYVGGDLGKYIALGGGLYSMNKTASRFGIQSRVEQATRSANPADTN